MAAGEKIKAEGVGKKGKRGKGKRRKKDLKTA